VPLSSHDKAGRPLQATQTALPFAMRQFSFIITGRSTRPGSRSDSGASCLRNILYRRLLRCVFQWAEQRRTWQHSHQNPASVYTGRHEDDSRQNGQELKLSFLPTTRILLRGKKKPRARDAGLRIRGFQTRCSLEEPFVSAWSGPSMTD
jgi:hypothetical protein